jgi:hypothetical protein
LQPQVRVQLLQELLLEQEQRLALLAQQKVVAVHRLLVQVFRLSYSDWQPHFQTDTIDKR